MKTNLISGRFTFKKALVQYKSKVQALQINKRQDATFHMSYMSYGKEIKPISFINQLSYTVWCHLVSIATSNPKNIDRTKYLQSIKAWDQSVTKNTVGFSLSCYISLIIWLRSQIMSPWFQSLLFYFFFNSFHLAKECI